MSEKKVLVVDDEQDSVDIVETMLSEIDGITVVSANDGDSCLEKAQKEIPDLIILDVQMPGKNGFEVFAELAKGEATSSIPVIMLTGIAEKAGIAFSSDDMKEFINKEPADYIEKPVEPKTLQDAVKKALGL